MKSEHTVALAMLDDQSCQGLTVDQHTTCPAGQAPRRTREGLVREDHGAPTTMRFHGSQCAGHDLLADSPALALESADEVFSALSEQEIHARLRCSPYCMDSIALGAQEVSRIAQECSIRHGLHILQNRGALALPPQRIKQPPEPDPTTHPEEGNWPVPVQKDGGEDQEQEGCGSFNHPRVGVLT
jgi:hypothetical protein